MSEISGPFLAIYRDDWTRRVQKWWRRKEVFEAGLGDALRRRDRAGVQMIVDHLYEESLANPPGSTPEHNI